MDSSTPSKRANRIPVAAGLILLLLVSLLAAAAAAQTLPPGGTFIDDDGNVHEGMIEAAVVAGITNGCDSSGPRYCPATLVTRSQMASFLDRAIGFPAGPDRFTDDDGGLHEPAINAIAAAGVTLGCDPADPTRFCPELAVSRGQMAAFLQRSLDLTVPTGSDRFVDDDGLVFEDAIEAIAAAGITTGCDADDPTRFCPDDFVRRDQMATFLGRAVGLTAIDPPPRLSADERMANDVASLIAFGPRPAGRASEHDAADWLFEQLVAITGSAERETVPLPNGGSSNNISSTFGDGPHAIVIGGHYDTVVPSPGADDNASGCAVVLEVARALIHDPPDGLTITVAFFGAEEGLPGFTADDHHFGSRQMAAELQAANDLPDSMLSIDMVGYGPDLLAVTYLNQLPEVAERLVAAGAEVGVGVTEDSRGDISDHEAFVNVGVPAAFLWRPGNPAYHTSDDDTIRPELLSENLQVVGAFLDRLSQDSLPSAGVSWPFG